MNIKQITIILFSSLFIASCGGGGGGGGGGASSTPTYTYSTLVERLDGGTISSFSEVGRSLIYTYHQESQANWYATRSENFNLQFSQGSNSSGAFIKVSYDQNVEVIPGDYSTSLDYRRSYEINIDGYEINQLYNSPNFSSAFEYYSNANLSIYGTWDPEVYPGTEYVDMIIWHMNYDNGYMDDFIAFAYGDKTYTGNMPSTGTASYNLASIGFWNYYGRVYNFKGDGYLSANFSNMKVSGELRLDYVTDDSFGWSQNIGSDAGNIVLLETDISGASFSGDLDWYSNDDSQINGSFEGSFFGPEAKEVGGTFEASEPDNGYNNNLIGSFIGTK